MPELDMTKANFDPTPTRLDLTLTESEGGKKERDNVISIYK